MALDEHQRFKLEDFVERMKSYRARHTELITVYVPKGMDLNLITRQLEAEKSTAANIKSSSTRKNVEAALDSLIRLAKTRKTPPNGAALFAGNVSQIEGQDDFLVEFFEPPEELSIRLYRCDQTFVTDPLFEMLEIKEVYGLVVIERKEATIGVLIGKKIKLLKHVDSFVPGKIRAGGQCLSPDTLIMKDNGEIIEIKDSHNPMLILSENFNAEITEKTPIISKWDNDKEIFKIITKYPRFEIKSSKEHTFFVRTEKGIEEKPLCQIKEGDYLIMPEKINLDLKKQKIDFKPIIKQNFNIKKINIPEFLDKNLAKLFGYYLGDGCYEIDRITFFEQRKEVAEYYKKLLEETFGISTDLRFREIKNYYQLRVYSRIISQLFRKYFNLSDKTLSENIPSIVLKSPDDILASFISGFFDAEGYVSSNRVALGINNNFIAKQLQFSLLRLGIISSINEYDNRKNPYSNNVRYTLAIDDIESLKRFRDFINFSSYEKDEKLKKLIRERSNKSNVRQIVVNGKDVARIIKNSGLSIRQFRCPDFFINKKQMSKDIFKKNILDKIKDEELRKRLEMFYLSNLIAVKISKIETIGFQKTIDIETKNHNFLANGIIVHNSSQRFHRVTEGLAKEFYRKVSELVKKEFFDMKGLKGILLGGPGPTKEDFLKEGNLTTALVDKILAVKDIGYADEHGLELLVDVSQDVLSGQEIVHEQKLLEKFFNMLGKEKDKTAYGEEDVRKALSFGAVDVLLLSRKLKKEKIREFEKLAEETSVKVELVSTDLNEGEQFLNLSGIGAMLRFKIT
ncbi:MAG: LAGLIDADG family homing endonuclease [Nanoarchaeota archaeon]|nr:LAGLIDADG family homing endonuclease [Nanoarchaeota archaeon]